MSCKKTHFCIECIREADYRIKRVMKKVCIRDKEYEFEVSEGVCENCGGMANIPGLMDSNAMEIYRQYRMRECIVKIDDIYNVMEVYNIGKAPLSLALQKMLYYVQGIHMALFGKEVFREECEAWAHGPVFREVYRGDVK